MDEEGWGYHRSTASSNIASRNSVSALFFSIVKYVGWYETTITFHVMFTKVQIPMTMPAGYAMPNERVPTLTVGGVGDKRAVKFSSFPFEGTLRLQYEKQQAPCPRVHEPHVLRETTVATRQLQFPGEQDQTECSGVANT